MDGRGTHGRGMVCDSCGAEVRGTADPCPSCGAYPAVGATSSEPVTAAPATTGATLLPGSALPPPTLDMRAPESPVAADTAETLDLAAPTGRIAADDATEDGPTGNHATELVIAPHEELDLDAQIFDPPTPSDAATATAVVDQTTAPATTAPATAAPAPSTGEVPTLFDFSADVEELPPERDTFKIRLVFLFALFGGVAAALVPAADVIDIRTTRPVDGIAVGFVRLDEIGTNLAVAAYAGIGVMVLGGLVACWGLRWAAGAAGGAGLALIGWAGLVIGLVEARIEIAEERTRTFVPTPDRPPFTLEITRDLGYWLIVAVAAIGLLVLLASLRLSRSRGRPGLNPWIAAVGAVSTLVLAVGPLIPVNGASFSDNFGSGDDSGILPTAYFAGRVGQVALIGVIGVIGFLLVRTYGLGLAAGSVSVAAWLWFSSLAELGEKPLGIADRNPGEITTTPHAVTTVGMVLTLVMLLVAAVAAAVQYRRFARR